MKGYGFERTRSGFPLSSGSLTLGLLLIILNCCVPWISCQSDIMYTLQEEEPENTFVANLQLDAELDIKYDAEDLAKLEFILNDRHGTKQGFRDFFHIETKSGILRTAKVIDRDAICPHQPKCPIPLNVMVQPGQYFQIIKITINVLDINDNRPIFPQSDMSLAISETTMPGSKFALSSAEDDDSGVYSVQKYHLVSGSSKFDLLVTNSSFGGMDIHLVVKEKLDRESADSYQMEVVAMDGGVPPKSGVMRLAVSVIDANDNNPTFDNYTYEVNVPENFPPGKTILKLHAHDPDSGANGQIFYRLADNTIQMYGTFFGVDANTGELYLKKALDFEKTQSYSLTVTANDQGLNSLPAYAKVILRVEDVNDHTPTITVNSLTSSGLVEVSEDAPIGTFVAHVSVVDNDAGPSGDIQCQMKSGQFELQQLYQTEFKIVTAALFDRERQEVYRLNLECSDNGVPKQTTSERIVVTVQDANDNAPVFSQQVYSVKMRERNAVGAFIVQVNATDADASRNRILSYGIPEGASQDMVVIDPTTGVIRADGSFDYEKEPIYEFPIIAVDRGDPPRTGTAILRVTVQDVNDEPPEFVRNSYSFEIEENRPAHSYVGTVSASDKDAHPYDVIKYSIDPFYKGLDAFKIDEDTGEITTVKILDREQKEVYHLIIVATNEGYPNTKSSINTSIFVLDQNDNSPVLEFPADLNNMAYIANDLPIGKEVTRVVAKDPDEGDNAKLSYSCTKGNQEGYFALNKTTGQVLVSKNLGSFDYYHFAMVIEVKDHGRPSPKSVTGDLHIIVNRSLAVIHFKNSSGFSFLNIENHHLIVGTVVIISLVVILIVVIIIVCCRQKQRTQGNKYNCRREAKKRDATRKDANGEWKPVPNYAVEATPNGPAEKPRKNVKFHVDKEDEAHDDGDGYWPPPPPPDVRDLNQRVSTVPKHNEGSKQLHSNGGVSLTADSKSPLLASPAKEKVPPNSPDPANFRGATNNRHGYPPLTQQELEELVTSAYQVLVVCRAQTPKPKNQMHEMLQLMPQDRDSETGSYTDSGRGPSEEGENSHQPHLETQLVDNNKNYRPDGTGRRSSNDTGPTWPRQHNTTNPSNLKSFTNPRPDKEIKYQNRIPSQPLDNRPVLKYSTFHHSSPTTAKQTSSPAHKLPSSGDPIWLPRQHSSDSHGSSQSSLSRTCGGGGHYAGLPGNCNNNNNNLGQVSHPNTPSPQHQLYCRVGVSPTCDSPGVREPLLPQHHGDNDSLGHSDGGTTTSGSYVVDHEGLGSKDSNLRSNGTLIL